MARAGFVTVKLPRDDCRRVGALICCVCWAQRGPFDLHCVGTRILKSGIRGGPRAAWNGEVQIDLSRRDALRLGRSLFYSCDALPKTWCANDDEALYLMAILRVACRLIVASTTRRGRPSLSDTEVRRRVAGKRPIDDRWFRRLKKRPKTRSILSD